MLYIFQKGFNYSQDGPGNRLVYHLSGCSLNCPWCSNPEGKPHKSGQCLSEESLLAEAISCKPMFFDGGGVTLTGGEVTEQFSGVEILLNDLKTHEVNTCIETNATHPNLPALFPLIDHLIMDIKHYDNVAHRKVIRCGLAVIMQNIRLAAAQRSQIALRIPLIGGFNSSEADASGFAALLADLGVRDIATVELLSYHEYGKDKYTKLGIPYPMWDNPFISDGVLNKFSHVLRENGFQIITS